MASPFNFCLDETMNVKELIVKYSTLEVVPVEVESVEKDINASGIPDIIKYWEAEINTDPLRGQINHWEYTESDGKKQRVADIYYGSELTRDWQRLVCCKELLHILDEERLRVVDNQHFEKLIEKIILPLELQDPIQDGTYVNNDRLAVYHAVAILFPLAVRNLLLPFYLEEKFTLDEIAKMVDLPVRYVSLVMSEFWSEIHEILIS